MKFTESKVMSIECVPLRRGAGWVTLLALLACLFSSPVMAQDSLSQLIAEAANAIEQARKASAEAYAVDDMAAARSWFTQAERANSSANSLLGRVATDRQKKARENEIFFFASMAKAKAMTAEAKAKKVTTLTETGNVQKVLTEYQGMIRIATERAAEASKARSEIDRARETQARADAERRQLAEAQKRVADIDAQRSREIAQAQQKAAELEAQKAREMAALQEQEARRAAERQREAEAARASQEQIAQMQAKLQVLEQEKAMLAAGAKVPGATFKSADGKAVFTLLVASLFSLANELSPAGRKTLDGVGAFLKAYPDGAVSIRSYTDDRGTPAANKDLSGKRAQKVREYLAKSHGIPESRLAAEGVGAAEPVATNATDAGRALNRRVEVSVSSGK